LDKNCESAVNKLSNEQFDISQGYLIATRGITVRIRKSVKKNGKKANSYYFTLKVNTAGRVIEIEKNIDERDFNDLWDIALNKLQKIRYIVKNNEDSWELDFFKDYRGETYMAVAEIEMPENQIEPDSVPDIVKKNLIYKVPLTDARFSNKLLGDARYAAELLQEILKNEGNE
jgi:CYTH domain-containing protein